MGIVRERQIEKAINEVDALFILINAVNDLRSSFWRRDCVKPEIRLDSSGPFCA